MCWLIVSLEMKTGWKKKVTEKHFSPLSTQENINWYCQTAIKKQESSVTFPCSLWSVGITFQAVDVGSCEHFGSRTVGFIIPKWIPGLTALCLLKCIQQTKDVPRNLSTTGCRIPNLTLYIMGNWKLGKGSNSSQVNGWAVTNKALLPVQPMQLSDHYRTGLETKTESQH